ncbi:hypothetical protein WJX72_000841 [[Myrmecia] bisecta]|uniref:EF-hand domain-containing protein n=1 Tax=[Myrmecia] bisecta TaxID=41462 RepID=A0AAW1QPK8_9CHLO
MAPDPRVAAQNYLEEHSLGPLFEAMTAALLVSKPEDPRRFLLDYLHRLQTGAAPPAITTAELQTMFDMFDITHTGSVSVEQATKALKTVLGPAAELQLDPEIQYGGMRFNKEAFVQHMQAALRLAAPTIKDVTC